MQAQGTTSGHLVVEDRKKGRVWIASMTLADGSRTRKVLGPAWVRDSGKRTARGAVKWRAADGTCPAGALTPKAAQAELDQMLEADRRTAAKRPTRHGVPWGEAAEAFIEHAETVGWKRGPVSAGVARGYRSTLRVLAGEASRGAKLEKTLAHDLPLQRITSRTLEELQEHELRAGVSRGTVRHHMRFVSMVLSFSRTRGWVGRNVMDDVTIVAQPGAAPDFRMLEPSQVEAVARAVAAVKPEEIPYYRAGAGAERTVVDERNLTVMRERRALWAEAVRVAAYTGLRLGELRALRWRDLDFPGAVVHVRRNAPSSTPGRETTTPKSKTARSVPLIDPAAEAFDRVSRHLEDHGWPTGAEDLVFPTREGGMLEAARVRDAFYRGLEAAELGHMREKPNPMTFHDLRHTFASIAVRVFPVSDVQAFLGHSSITTTMRYVHHVPRTDAAAKLSAAFARDLNPVGLPA